MADREQDVVSEPLSLDDIAERLDDIADALDIIRARMKAKGFFVQDLDRIRQPRQKNPPQP
jgi:hypothetical protein